MIYLISVFLVVINKPTLELLKILRVIWFVNKKQKMSKTYSHFIFALISSISAFSQLSITNNNSAITLAQNIVGSGITVTNATLNCGPNAAGVFSYAGSHLGLTNGILLTTGSAQSVSNPGSYLCNVVNGHNFTDPNVTAISPQAIYDVCILQFDFTPICDTLKIAYVFGSDEYPQYINQYNDVFALFLSGPKPSGGSYTSQNIATLPNGITPVAIDSVNGGWPIGTGASHANYYVNNYTSPNNDIAFNGYTIPITSVAAVLPCSNYHMKIALADAGNGHNDSGVFIEGNAFSCQNSPSVTIASVASCSNNGTASVSVSNYVGSPSYTWVPGNQHTSSISNLSSGSYTCIVALPGLCSNYTLTTTVGQPSPLTVSNATVCSGSNITLNASGANSYTWSPSLNLNSSTGASVISTPSSTSTYTVVGIDVFGCNKTTTVTVTVNSVPVFSSTVNSPVCYGKTINLAVSSLSNTSYSWSGPNSFTSSLQNPVISNASSTNSGSYTITVTSNSCSASSILPVVVDVPLIISSNTTICNGNSAQLNANGVSTYTWSPSNGLSNPFISNPIANPISSTQYTVSGTNQNGCINQSIVLVSVSSVTSSISANVTGGNAPLSVSFFGISNGVNNNWNFGNGSSLNTTNNSTNTIFQNPGTYTVTMISNNTFGCTNTVSLIITVDENELINIPNVFTPNGDGNNDFYNVKNIGYKNIDIVIYDRWGIQMWQSNSITDSWDGKHNGKDVPDATYFYIIKTTSTNSTLKNYKGPILLIR